jgi:hypothetical protein
MAPKTKAKAKAKAKLARLQAMARAQGMVLQASKETLTPYFPYIHTVKVSRTL